MRHMKWKHAMRMKKSDLGMKMAQTCPSAINFVDTLHFPSNFVKGSKIQTLTFNRFLFIWLKIFYFHLSQKHIELNAHI